LNSSGKRINRASVPKTWTSSPPLPPPTPYHSLPTLSILSWRPNQLSYSVALRKRPVVGLFERIGIALRSVSHTSIWLFHFIPHSRAVFCIIHTALEWISISTSSHTYTIVISVWLCGGKYAIFQNHMWFCAEA
jgi:hypothetical protein